MTRIRPLHSLAPNSLNKRNPHSTTMETSESFESSVSHPMSPAALALAALSQIQSTSQQSQQSQREPSTQPAPPFQRAPSPQPASTSQPVASSSAVGESELSGRAAQVENLSGMSMSRHPHPGISRPGGGMDYNSIPPMPPLYQQHSPGSFDHRSQFFPQYVQSQHTAPPMSGSQHHQQSVPPQHPHYPYIRGTVYPGQFPAYGIAGSYGGTHAYGDLLYSGQNGSFDMPPVPKGRGKSAPLPKGKKNTSMGRVSAQKFSDADLRVMINLVNLKKHWGAVEWDKVAEQYNTSYAIPKQRSLRNGPSLKAQFSKLANTLPPTGNTEEPPLVTWAKSVNKMLNDETGIGHYDDGTGDYAGEEDGDQTERDEDASSVGIARSTATPSFSGQKPSMSKIDSMLNRIFQGDEVSNSQLQSQVRQLERRNETLLEENRSMQMDLNSAKYKLEQDNTYQQKKKDKIKELKAQLEKVREDNLELRMELAKARALNEFYQKPPQDANSSSDFSSTARNIKTRKAERKRTKAEIVLDSDSDDGADKRPRKRLETNVN